MQDEFDRRWNKLAQEVLSGMRDWRAKNTAAKRAGGLEKSGKRPGLIPGRWCAEKGAGRRAGSGAGGGSDAAPGDRASGSGASAYPGRANGRAAARATGKPSGAEGGVDEPGWLLPPNGGRRVERGQDGGAGGGQ